MSAASENPRAWHEMFRSGVHASCWDCLAHESFGRDAIKSLTFRTFCFYKIFHGDHIGALSDFYGMNAMVFALTILCGNGYDWRSVFRTSPGHGV